MGRLRISQGSRGASVQTVKYCPEKQARKQGESPEKERATC